MEKAKAIITSDARIFLREMFRIALLIIPMLCYLRDYFLAAKKRLEGELDWAVIGLMAFSVFSNPFLVAVRGLPRCVIK